MASRGLRKTYFSPFEGLWEEKLWFLCVFQLFFLEFHHFIRIVAHTDSLFLFYWTRHKNPLLYNENNKKYVILNLYLSLMKRQHCLYIIFYFTKHYLLIYNSVSNLTFFMRCSSMTSPWRKSNLNCLFLPAFFTLHFETHISVNFKAKFIHVAVELSFFLTVSKKSMLKNVQFFPLGWNNGPSILRPFLPGRFLQVISL
mgnify:CR=1 FL=1